MIGDDCHSLASRGRSLFFSLSCYLHCNPRSISLLIEHRFNRVLSRARIPFDSSILYDITPFSVSDIDLTMPTRRTASGGTGGQSGTSATNTPKSITPGNRSTEQSPTRRLTLKTTKDKGKAKEKPGAAGGNPVGAVGARTQARPLPTDDEERQGTIGMQNES